MKVENESIFALETVIMAVLLGMAGWAGIEIVKLNEAVAEVRTRQTFTEETSDVIVSMSKTLARLEESQTNLKERVISNGEDIRELTNHVRDLHRK